MIRLHLVRHGPTHANTMVGWSDLPADLSDTGALARLDAALPLGAVVVSSDLTRAVATADAIGGTRARLDHDPDLREIHFGVWELRAFADIEAEDPERIRAFWERPGEVRAPGGESWDRLRERVDGAVDRLIAEQTDRDLIVVAHFGAILTQVQRAEGLSTEEAFAHRLDPLSLTRIACGPDGWQVEAINHRP